MSNAKLPHKHQLLIKQWADGAEIQMRNKDFGSADVGPEWRDCSNPLWTSYDQYRVKPKPKYPKSTLDYARAWTIYTSYRGRKNDGEANLEVAHAAVAEFIESGEMVKYFTNPDNGYITLTENF